MSRDCRGVSGAIEIIFISKKLQQSCSSESETKRRWGDMAPIIRRRLVQIEAAETLADLLVLPGRCHLLTGDRAGAWALDVRHGWRLVFEPAELTPQEEGATEFSSAHVTKVRVINIEDYHG